MKRAFTGKTAEGLVLAGAMSLICGGITACSSMPIKMQCSEIQARIDYGDLSGDQLRFATQELEDCRGRQTQAEKKDSGFVDNTEKRFTPDTSLGLGGTGSSEQGSGKNPVSGSGGVADSTKLQSGK